MWGHGVLGMEDKRRPEAACICDGMVLLGRIFDGGVTNNRLHSYTGHNLGGSLGVSRDRRPARREQSSLILVLALWPSAIA